MNLDNIIEQTAEPDVTSNRLQSLLEQKKAGKLFNSFSDEQKSGLINVIGISRFLYYFLSRHPDALALIGSPYKPTAISTTNVSELRYFKYQSLLQITVMDISNHYPYEQVLSALSHLADTILQQGNLLIEKQSEKFSANFLNDLAVMALGKLGANELNYSSDVDLIFVMRNADEKKRHEMHEHYTRHIRNLCRLLEENTEEGFLYRVDLNLRPWGRSAPLVFSLEENEDYYQASKEAWERIAWLRGRCVAGSKELGNEMISSMKPFVFHKVLSTEEIDRFLKIKNDMSDQRQKAGHWNVKLGEGGIRDIEFFVHMLQIVNGAHFPELQITNTLELLKQLAVLGLISKTEQKELTDSYIFLRRLENRLQMIDEQQTHQLPNDRIKLKKMAKYMGYCGETIDEVFDDFNDDLILNQQVARKYFEKLLTDYKEQ